MNDEKKFKRLGCPVDEDLKNYPDTNDSNEPVYTYSEIEINPESGNYTKNPKKKVQIGIVKKTNYNALMLLEDLRNELEKLLPPEQLWVGKLSESTLGELLGRDKNYIKDVLKRQIRRNPEHIISLETLEEFESSLCSRFGEKSKNLIKFIAKYRNLNNPPKSTKYQIYKHHPNFNINYFEDIDTKEKAYWLGFLYADGYFERMEGYKLRIGIELNIKDRIILELFAEAVGLDPNRIEERTRRSMYKGEVREYNHVTLRFINSKMADDLKKQGLKEVKSKKIELPDLKTRELNLAFLLGFFDGEGWEGTTKFSCGSKIFVDQVKEKYKLPYKIKPTKSGAWRTSLGAKLFNEMMDNYKYSLFRKRNYFEERRYNVKKEFEELMTKSKLEELIWEMSIVKIAEKFGVLHGHVTDLCNKWGIDLPPLGYWKRKRFSG